MKVISVFTLALALMGGVSVSAQCDHTNAHTQCHRTHVSMQWGATAGLNLGATAPLPIPKEITKVHAWYPKTNGVLGLWGRMRFSSSPWGLQLGLESERKAFEATTAVTDLPISIPGFESGDPLKFMGLQNSQLTTSYLTMPIAATFSMLNDSFVLQLGVYHSLLLSGAFKVKVDGDGTIEGMPIAPKQILTFDFSDYVAAYDFGLRFGAEYFFTRSVGITARFNFGVMPALREEFRSIPHKMHHMYGMIGASYRFRS